MIRALLLTAAVALATPAFADSSTRNGALFNETDARSHLQQLGYSQVSQLVKDENGVWHGTAVKGGERRVVAVDLKGGAAQ